MAEFSIVMVVQLVLYGRRNALTCEDGTPSKSRGEIMKLGLVNLVK